MFPIIGGRKIEHLEGNIKALDITLTPAQIEALESVLPFDTGFPSSMIVSSNDRTQALMSHLLSAGWRYARPVAAENGGVYG